MKEILLTINFEPQHMKEFIDYCRAISGNNDRQLEYIDKFERQYRDKKPIWWYTSDCFICPMLNHALRMTNVDIIMKMGFFIRDLHSNIE
jgi:hypothetical protein